MLHLKVSRTAVNDIESGMLWYEAQQTKLGEQFEAEVNSTFQSIRRFPYAASFAYDTVRYKVVKHFPYIVLYETDDLNIYVLRVFNTYQKPIG